MMSRHLGHSPHLSDLIGNLAESCWRLFRDQECLVLTATAEADMSCFTDGELAIIDTVCAKMKSLSAHDISELSHKELAWQRHLHQVETIPYEEAFSLVMV